MPQEYRAVAFNTCTKLVQEHHYSKRMPGNPQLSYGVVEYGPPRVLLACAIFSIPASRWEISSILELTRLVRVPSFEEPLTKLISKALGHIRKLKLTDLVVSFADTEEDHHGGIYQACSWVYDGRRNERLDGINLDGVFVPARTLNSVYGTSSPDELVKLLPDKHVEPHFDQGKHCYWKALSKEGMRAAVGIGLRSMPYPKPMLKNGEQVNYVVDETRKKGVIDLPAFKPPPPTGVRKFGKEISGG